MDQRGGGEGDIHPNQKLACFVLYDGGKGKEGERRNSGTTTSTREWTRLSYTKAKRQDRIAPRGNVKKGTEVVANHRNVTATAM